MRTGERGVDLIKSFEGCKLNAYRCSAGVLTIGYGHTGPHVVEGQVITQQRADELLASDLEEFEESVSSNVRVPLTQNQFDALVAFTFNVGTNALRSSTLLRKINAGDAAGAADEFLRWDKVKKVPSKGLARRRAAERELFLS